MFLIFYVLEDFFLLKKWVWGILGQPYCGIGATIHIGREMLSFPYAGFFAMNNLGQLNTYDHHKQAVKAKHYVTNWFDCSVSIYFIINQLSINHQSIINQSSISHQSSINQLSINQQLIINHPWSELATDQRKLTMTMTDRQQKWSKMVKSS